MKRVLLKLSGEALAGDKKTGFDEATCIGVARQVKSLVDDGIQVAIVTGGGNFWRGRTSETIDRVKADQIGMLATVMNCIYVSDIFRYVGMKTEVFTPFVCGAFTKLFSKDAAVEALDGDYWPDTALLPDMLEMTFGISSDMYEDYMAEVPMISENVDTLLIVRAKDDKVEAVRDALEAYRDAQINNTMQYPMNVGKVQASRIETVGNYVMFVQLGGDTMQAAEEGDEAVVAMCQEINDKAVEAIRGRL